MAAGSMTGSSGAPTNVARGLQMLSGMSPHDYATLLEHLALVLATHPTIKLATASLQAEPWVATAYYGEETPFSLVMMLEEGGRSLKNLTVNPRVSLMLEGGDAMAPFAQASGVASRVDGDEAFFARVITDKAPESAPLLALPGLVPVRVAIERWRITDVPRGWLPAREVSFWDGQPARVVNA